MEWNLFGFVLVLTSVIFVIAMTSLARQILVARGLSTFAIKRSPILRMLAIMVMVVFVASHFFVNVFVGGDIDPRWFRFGLIYLCLVSAAEIVAALLLLAKQSARVVVPLCILIGINAILLGKNLLSFDGLAPIEISLGILFINLVPLVTLKSAFPLWSRSRLEDGG